MLKKIAAILTLLTIMLLPSTPFLPSQALLHASEKVEIFPQTDEADFINSIALSSDGKYFVTGGYDRTVRLWEIMSGREIRKFPGHSTVVTSVAFSKDGKLIVSGSSDQTVRIWEVSSGKEIKRFTVEADQGENPMIRIAGGLVSPEVWAVAISSNGRYVAATCWDACDFRFFDVSTEKPLKSDCYFSRALSVTFSPDDQFILAGGRGKEMILYEVSSGKSVRRFAGFLKGHSSNIRSVAFSPDGKYALSGSDDETMILWDVATGEIIRKFKGHENLVRSVTFTPDGKHILSGSEDKTVRLWDVSTGKEVKTVVQLPYPVSSIAVTADGRFVAYAGKDGRAGISEIKSGKEIVQFFTFKDGEWITLIPEGYYDSSQHGHKYLSLRRGKDVYQADQFYDVFYRPDIVSARLREEDIKPLISLTIDEAIKNPPPQVEFTSSPPDKEITTPRVKVCYQAKSTGGGIGEVRVFHNGKLVRSDGFYRDIAKAATEGKIELALLNSRAIREDLRNLVIRSKADSRQAVSKPKGDKYTDCMDIEVVPGDNDVSVSAFNKGNIVQSSMKTVSFKAKLAAVEPHLYILVVGIDQYKNRDVNLKYAVKDARDIREKLVNQSATLYKQGNIHSIVLTDKEATKLNIRDKISEWAGVIKPTDGFILFVAGHGVLLENQYFMLTNDFDGRLSEKAMVSSNEIVEASKKIKSLNQLLIFDTCHAGGVDYLISGLYDSRMAVLAKKMGLHIYASASDKQAAMDGYKGNGLFTHTLLDGLSDNKEADKYRDGKVTIVGLGEYSKKKTSSLSKEIGHSQTPLIINFGKDNPIYQLR